MRNFKIIILLSTMMLLAACGKSPLFNKLETKFEDVSGSVFITEKFPASQTEFIINWIIPPSLEEMGIFDLKLSKALKDNQSINAYIWMPEMGHGSSPFEMVKSDPTSYRFSEIAFIMPGLWVLHIEIIENNKVVDEWQKSITL